MFFCFFPKKKRTFLKGRFSGMLSQLSQQTGQKSKAVAGAKSTKKFFGKNGACLCAGLRAGCRRAPPSPGPSPVCFPGGVRRADWRPWGGRRGATKRAPCCCHGKR